MVRGTGVSGSVAGRDRRVGCEGARVDGLS